MKLDLLETAQILRIFKSSPLKNSRADPDRPLAAKFYGIRASKDLDPTAITALSEAWKNILSKERNNIHSTLFPSSSPLACFVFFDCLLPSHKPVTRKDTKEVVKKVHTSKKLSEVLVNYPPPPAPPNQGIVTVTRYDYNMLDPGEFLNDTIIEFYLKCITLLKSLLVTLSSICSPPLFPLSPSSLPPLSPSPLPSLLFLFFDGISYSLSMHARRA